jgi:N-acetyl-gamma-glutamyl-phosphate reductase
MISCCVVGASGYTGAELANLLMHHPQFSLDDLFVSEQSEDAGKTLQTLHGHLASVELNQLVLTPLSEGDLNCLGDKYDSIFLATPHQASHDWMSKLAGKKAAVFDLSGAFRIKDLQVFEKFYGFKHQENQWLDKSTYGLVDWFPEQIKQTKIIAVPGCYPTASLLGLKPLQHENFIAEHYVPVINAVSGVSGAGRKATLTNSFCEVSLQAYGVLGHRHQPEIESYLGRPVIFTPHLGNFKRGILATITVQLKKGITSEQVEKAYSKAYADQPLIQVRTVQPKIDDVVKTPYCHLCWQFDEQSGYLVVTSAIDNLLKGAASQALQCANVHFGLQVNEGLL